MKTPEEKPESPSATKAPGIKNPLSGKLALTAGLVAGTLVGVPGVYLGKTAYETVPSAVMGEATDQVKEAAREALEALNEFKNQFIPFLRKFVRNTSWRVKLAVVEEGGAGMMSDIYNCLADDRCTPEKTFERIVGKMDSIMPRYPMLKEPWAGLKQQFTVVQQTSSRALLFTKALTDGDLQAFDSTKMLDAAWTAFRDEVRSDFSSMFTSDPESESPER